RIIRIYRSGGERLESRGEIAEDFIAEWQDRRRARDPLRDLFGELRIVFRRKRRAWRRTDRGLDRLRVHRRRGRIGRRARPLHTATRSPAARITLGSQKLVDGRVVVTGLMKGLTNLILGESRIAGSLARVLFARDSGRGSLSLQVGGGLRTRGERNEEKKEDEGSERAALEGRARGSFGRMLRGRLHPWWCDPEQGVRRSPCEGNLRDFAPYVSRAFRACQQNRQKFCRQKNFPTDRTRLADPLGAREPAVC